MLHYSSTTTLRAIARAAGSTATTTAGARRYLYAHLPPSVFSGPLSPLRPTTRSDKARWLRQARFAQHRTIPPITLSGLIAQYVRHSAEQYSTTHPIVVVAEGKPTLCGSSYDFRWRGRWKSASGSYQPSTHRIEVGIDWLGAVARDVRASRYGGSACLYRGETAVHSHGYTAYVGRLGNRPIWYVEADRVGRAVPWAYHAPRSGATTRAAGIAAIRTAVHARRQQRKTTAIVRAEARTLAAIWVSPADSIAAGNCVPATEQYLAQLQREFGAIGALRADVLLARRDDQYTRRAVRAAQQRQEGN